VMKCLHSGHGDSSSGYRRGMVQRATALSERARRFLLEPRGAVLGTLNPDRSPHLTVIWYELREDEIVFNTTASRVKARNLSRDPRASILVGDMSIYVRIDGRGREVASGGDALEDIRRLAIRYDGPEAAERQVREVWSKQDRVTYALSIERVYEYGLE